MGGIVKKNWRLSILTLIICDVKIINFLLVNVHFRSNTSGPEMLMLNQWFTITCELWRFISQLVRFACPRAEKWGTHCLLCLYDATGVVNKWWFTVCVSLKELTPLVFYEVIKLAAWCVGLLRVFSSEMLTMYNGGTRET